MVTLVEVPESPPVTMDGLFGFSLEKPEGVIASAVLRWNALVYNFRYSGDKNVTIHVDHGVVQGTFWEQLVQWTASSVFPGRGPAKFSGEVVQPCVVLEGMTVLVEVRHEMDDSGVHRFRIFDRETGVEYHQLTCQLVDAARLAVIFAKRARRRMAAV